MVHGWVRLIAAYIIISLVFPKSIAWVDFRAVSAPLFISVIKNSPAYAALEDTRSLLTQTDQDSNFIETYRESQLQSGQELSESMIKVIEIDLAPPPLEKWQPLNGLVITRVKTPANKFQELDPENVFTKTPVAKLYGSGGRLLSVQQRKENLLKQYEQKGLAGPTVAQKAQILIEMELKKTAKIREKIMIVKPTSPELPPASREKPAPPQEPPAENRTGFLEDNPEEPNRELSYTLFGNLQMTGGLAYTGDDEELVVFRVDQGQLLEQGQIFISEGRYKIYVEELKGYIVAELRDRSGDLIGYDELSLFEISGIPRNESRIEGMDLSLSPAANGLVTDVISAKSYDNVKIPVKKPRLFLDSLGREIVADSEGQFRDGGIINSSSYVLRAQSKNHWGSLAVGLSGYKSEVRLFPETLVTALLNITVGGLDEEEMDQYGIVWGRVILNGEPVTGAEVELAGEQNIHPVYFNHYIPDKKMTRTGKDGLFAFVKVIPGIQAVRVFYEGRYLPAEVIPAEARQVSYVSIPIVKMKTARVRVFDGLDTTINLPATLNVVGTEDYIEVEAVENQRVKIPGGKGMMLLEVDSGDPYFISRMTIDRSSQHINVPMVHKKWLENQALEKKINVVRNTGTVVGFIQGSDFEVFMDQQVKYSRNNIVYFDQEGTIIYGDKGVAGGGFVMFNAPAGYRSIAVLPDDGTKVFTQIVVTEPDVVSVLSKAIP